MSTRRAHNNTGRSNGTAAERHARKLNAPPHGEAWFWITKEMLESAAYRALSAPARKVIDRIALEHMAHAGGHNGKLPVTYQDFRAYGVRRSSINGAIAEAIELGFIERTDDGSIAWGEFKGKPARYRLAWLKDFEGASAPNRWKRFDTVSKARDAAHRAQEKASERARERLRSRKSVDADDQGEADRDAA
jgi:hypothetical protein